MTIPKDSSALSESNVDVLVVGAGPAGLGAASWMSRLGIKCRIVDKRRSWLISGHADGINPRSREIFASLGVGDEISRRAVWMEPMRGWGPGPEGLQKLPLTPPDYGVIYSNRPSKILAQPDIEEILVKSIEEHGNFTVEHCIQPIAYEDRRKTHPDYPVRVTLRHLTQDEARPAEDRRFTKKLGSTGETSEWKDQFVRDQGNTINGHAPAALEVINAKYVIAADGAHSWFRKQLGIEMKGAQTDYIWGVVDIKPVTNFPDIRKCVQAQTADGAILIIPRERDLVRLYIHMKEAKPSTDSLDSAAATLSSINPDTILDVARKVLHPYELDYEECDWWTAYQIGQRLATRYVDDEQDPRIFLAGDAVHTHSPKAGQGMNTSFQDTFNLGWKLAGVIQGKYKPEILQTYESERRAVGQRLLNLDTALAAAYSGTPDTAALQKLYLNNMTFIQGVDILYPASSLIAPPSSLPNPWLSNRIAPVPLLRQPASNRAPTQADVSVLHDLLPADGAWTLLVLPGDLATAPAKERLAALAAAAVPLGAVKTLLLHASSDAAALATAKDEVEKLFSADRVFADLMISKAPAPVVEAVNEWYRHNERGMAAELLSAYRALDVDAATGAMFLVRPDMHVSWAGAVSAAGWAEVRDFFAGCLV